MPTRRNFLLGLAGTALLGAACVAEPGKELDQVTARLAAEASPDQSYRHPSAEERDRGLVAAAGLLAADLHPDTVAMFGELGFETSAATDQVTGRPYHLAVSRSGGERTWGALVVDLGAPASIVVEVPHTRSDKRTEEIGLALFRAVPGSVLLIAGAHRRAAAGRADVAHERDSMFHTLATYLADRGLPQLQLHGYADDSAPGEQAVVSPGAGGPNGWTELVAEGIDKAGLAVCRTWRSDCRSLSGRRNVQGIDAAEGGHPFVHVEISRAVRDDDRQRATLVAALAGAAVSEARR